MRLLNVCGAKGPRRVLIPAIDASVPFRRPAAGCRAPRLVLPRRGASCDRAAAVAAIAAAGAGSSPRATISSLCNADLRRGGALGVTLWSKAAELGRIKEFLGR
jgi:hypothetical protein